MPVSHLIALRIAGLPVRPGSLTRLSASSTRAVSATTGYPSRPNDQPGWLRPGRGTGAIGRAFDPLQQQPAAGRHQRDVVGGQARVGECLDR